MLTDNPVLVRCHRQQPALMCVQRKADKMIVSEDDLIRANIASFGDDIGKTTNWATSMYDVQARFEPGSPEYDELEYRIMSSQLFQQNAIDKAKGIIAKPMPRNWHDKHSVAKIEDSEKRRFYYDIVAEKKPYFMRYIYPALMRQYNTYIKNTDKNALREFAMTVEELLEIPESDRTDRQSEFIRYYHARMPVGTNNCVMNRICRRFESEFDGFLRRHNAEVEFDYSVMKSDAEYTRNQYITISRLFDDYQLRMQRYKVFAEYERVEDAEKIAQSMLIRDEYLQSCTLACPDAKALCNIVLDLCYERASTKRFAWSICSEEIIDNLLEKNRRVLEYPTLDPDGDIYYGGNRFSIVRHEIVDTIDQIEVEEENDEPDSE